MKTNRTTCLILGFMLLVIPLCQAQNILIDGDFTTTTTITPFYVGTPPANVWCTWLNSGNSVVASASVTDGVCYYQVTNPGYNTWDIQLAYWGFILTPGHNYRLTFDVKADASRTFGVFIGQDGGAYTNFNALNYSQTATTVWSKKTIDFSAPVTYLTHKMSFEIGAINTSMYFDNVVLEDLGPLTPIYLYDGSFSTTTTITPEISSPPPMNVWCIFQSGISPEEAYASVADNTCIYQIINGGSGPWEVQLTQYGFYLNYSHTYRFSFDVKADAPRTFGLYLGEYLGNWTNYLGWGNYNQEASTEWKTLTFDFAATNLFAVNKLSFEMGGINTNMYFRNISLQDLGPYTSTVGIVGSALTGWDNDINMQSTDGIVYTLTEYPFINGEVKFRADKSWTVNWGNSTFPSGMAYQDGPNIPVLAGTYDVVFNRLTGEYLFTATSCPVAGIQCPYDQYFCNDWDKCGAVVYYPAVTAAANCGGPGITVIQTAGLASGSFFPVGTTTNSFLLTNAEGETATCSFSVYVFDCQPPVISTTSDSIKPLWPPNHEMINVPIKYSDLCGNVYGYFYIYSNEPESGLGDGDKSPDWQIVDEHNILLRAERSGKGMGREYYIDVYCYDDNWNFAYQQLIVKVPHDMGKTELADGYASDNQLSVDVWPNPATQNFNLQVNSPTDESIEVQVNDVAGRLVDKLLIPNTTTYTFGGDLQPGVYFLKVIQGNSLKTMKIVKE